MFSHLSFLNFRTLTNQASNARLQICKNVTLKIRKSDHKIRYLFVKKSEKVTKLQISIKLSRNRALFNEKTISV